MASSRLSIIRIISQGHTAQKAFSGPGVLILRKDPGYNRAIMRESTLKLTTGAVIVALFMTLMFFNRQTGGMLEGIFIYLFPIPMVAYAAKYGLKSSIPVLIAMALSSVFLGTPMSIFYALSAALIGLVLGTCIYRGTDSAKTLFAVILIAVLVNVIDMFLLAFLFGNDLNSQVSEMQTMMAEVFTSRGLTFPEQILTADYLKRILIVSVVFTGVMQGFIVYTVSLLLLRRLRYKIEAPRSLFSFYPPKALGYVCAVFFLLFGATSSHPLSNKLLQDAVQLLGITAYVILIIFGAAAFMLYIRKYLPAAGIFSGILAVFGALIAAVPFAVAGFAYISLGLHDWLLKPRNTGSSGGRGDNPYITYRD